METERLETVVEKAVAHVKDMGSATPRPRNGDAEVGPIRPSGDGETAAGENVGISGDDLAFKGAVDTNAESARREDGE